MKLRLAISVLVLGDGDDPHFAEPAEWLKANLPCRFATGDSSALAATYDDVEPTLVVLLQSRPGQFTVAELSGLRRRWPLARFVAIAAGWCEGEPRSGAPHGGVYRVPWHAAVDRLSAELHSLVAPSRTAHLGGMLQLPATATVDERLLANSRPLAVAPAVVAVAAVRASVAEPLIEALAAAGHVAVFWPLPGGMLVRGVDALVWDTFACEGRIGELRCSLPPLPGNGPIVAVADFPRPQGVSLLAELGVHRVLGKPLLVADLLTSLDELLARTRVEPARKAAVA